MRFIPALSLIFLIACGNGGLKEKNDPVDTASTGDDDDDDDTDTDTDIPFVSSYTSGKYRFSSLSLVTDTDIDDDGTIDNKLPDVLGVVDLFITTEDFSVAGFNANMAANLDSWTTNILMFAEHDGAGSLRIDLLQGNADDQFNLTIEPTSLDNNGDARAQLFGSFDSETAFVAGPDDFEVPITFLEGLDPLPVDVANALLEGELLADDSSGTITGALPIDEVAEKVIEPLIAPGGVDLNGNGTIEPNETKDGILDLVLDAAELAADVDLDGDGVKDAISARFTFVAAKATWPDP